MDRPKTAHPTRRPLGDASLRSNEDNRPQRREGEKRYRSEHKSSPQPLPHEVSLVPNGTLAVRHQPEPSPEHKRVSAISSEHRDTNRDSQISTVSSNGSGPRKRKTHIGPWQLGKTVGRGGCGRVRLVKHTTTGQYGAAKIISKATAEKVRALSLANLIKSAEEEQSMFPGGKVIPFGLEREIVIMKLLDHPNIVRLHDVWENRNELYLVMEYVQGGDLFQYMSEVGDLREIEVVHLFRQIIAALLYCHRLKIYHRDLKPENILLDRTNWQIKLVDFGMAALQPEGRKLSTPCGSPHYAAPEVIKFKAYDGGMADVWSCGVILYVMLTRSPPFNNYTGDQQDDRGLRELFKAISQANYIMPDDLSKEAQDLIRRILVPDPKRRIGIQQIWHHPFLHKYDKELGFEGDNANMEAWIGPIPKINDWKVLTRQTIDREILRNMRTLWHSVKEEVIVQQLLSKDANREKYFYMALLKHRQEYLETYAEYAPSVGYSPSDHHHHVIPAAPSERDMGNLPSTQHTRSKSQYSILNNEHLHSKHSFYEPPPSEASYDPFRASREVVLPQASSPMNITVHRRSSENSHTLRPVTALGHRQGSSLRIQALKNTNRRSSTQLTPVHLRKSSPAQSYRTAGMNGRSVSRSTLGYSQRSAGSRRRSLSRSTLGSVQWQSTPPVPIIITPSSMKRGVSFNHLKRTSTTATATTNQSTGPQYTPEQHKFLNHPSNASSSIKSTRPVTQPRYTGRPSATATISPKVLRLRMRKPESPSKYIQSEARKVSCELEKVMDRAFNRGSMSSSIMTSTTDRHGAVLDYDTPPTSWSNRNSAGCTSMATPDAKLKAMIPDRPLPPLPKETPNSFLKRKLAETREEIARKLQEEVGDNTSHFNDVLEQLDNLMAPSNDSSKRTSSAPGKAPLPAISEEGTGARPTLEGLRRATEQPTIRLVEQSPTHIAPLNIRKRSGASIMSKSSNEAEAGPSVPWPGSKAPATHVRPFFEPIFDQKLTVGEITAQDRGTSKDVLKEKAPAPTLNKKKSSWFRRHTTEKEHQEEKQSKGDKVQKFPDAWKGLDDRIKSDRVPAVVFGTSSAAANADKEPSETSSEFPMRRNGGGKMDRGLKGLMNLFGRKSKDCKGKMPMDLGSDATHSTDSFVDPSFIDASFVDPTFDISEDATASRTPEIHLNWLSRFLHIKPATKALCFQVGRGRARNELYRILRDWQCYGVENLHMDAMSNIIHASVSKNNQLKMKPVSLVIELFVVLKHGRRTRLCIARFTQTRGAASSFRRVVDILEDICRANGLVVEDERKRLEMLGVLDLV
ncbi:Pkinase-domain-containing protein [Delitschia confertaspora ATCC 74209]|uniref:non-specific serine/threonine protein kinase n=1 Tax=Delitschia confertaspora ATCC 74209 TaxID=1513339 RepID=A0A9P4JLT2_9PLEO|nr:Pkinase-domain-containing protein [Delitschia confertaspora ATCC 74209]